MQDLPPEFFRRKDERPDMEFYLAPRSESHLDEPASVAALALYAEILPPSGAVLDLMAGSDSHLPRRFQRVAGLGLNAEELAANGTVTEPVVFDLNRKLPLPFGPGEFDGAVCTVSVQYMTRPCHTFAEVARCLKPGAPFVVTFSTRMFPNKAVLAWRCSDDAAHERLVHSYFAASPVFGPVQRRHFLPHRGTPLFALWAHRTAAGPEGSR